MFIVGKLKTGRMKGKKKKKEVYACESESDKNARISEVLYEGMIIIMITIITITIILE